MPTVVIASDDFQQLAQNAAQALGLPEARIFTVAHPIGGVADDTLRRRAEAGTQTIMSLFEPERSTEDAE